MSKFRLKDNHPFMERVNKVMQFAEEQGVSFEFSLCNLRTFVTDTKEEKEYLYEDVDSGNPVKSFPAQYEFKLTYEKD